MIIIDGSQGEGGGQVLRTSLALSMITGQPFKIKDIRAGRSKPGLLRQHLTCVQAAVAVSDAAVTGAEMGSNELTFIPEKIKNGNFGFSVGTAGSTMLVLQTVLPALLTADGPSMITLEGGTHNPFAPPFNFLEKAFIPLINRMGPRIEINLVRYGFYPAGGGKVEIKIDPAEALSTLEIIKRGEIFSKRGEALYSNLSQDIGKRELETIQKQLLLESSELNLIKVTNSPGPGNLVSISIESEHVTEVFSGFGERGVSAERVASKACQEAANYLDSNAAIGTCLADQLLIPMALAGKGSFSTTQPSMHTLTNKEVIQKFLDIPIELDQESESFWKVEIG